MDAENIKIGRENYEIFNDEQFAEPESSLQKKKNEKLPGNLNFSGKLSKFSKFLARTLTKKYKFDVKTPETPTVYLCRHLDMHGVYTVNKSAKFDMANYAYHVFFNRKECFNHFYRYTFSVRFKRCKMFAVLPSFICSVFLPPLIKSSGAIPVYRKNAEALKTIKLSLNSLLSGKNILIFADKDYSDKTPKESGEIYEGFFELDRLYYKKTGKRVNFVPLYIDETARAVRELPPVTFTGEKDYAAEREEIKKKVIKGIFTGKA